MRAICGSDTRARTYVANKSATPATQGAKTLSDAAEACTFQMLNLNPICMTLLEAPYTLELVRQLGLITTPLVIFYAIYGILKEYYAYQTRRRLIEQGLTEDQLQTLFGKDARPREGARASLKWGLMVMAIGLALFISQPLTAHLAPSGAVSITLGLMFTLAGVALILFYRLTHRQP